MAKSNKGQERLELVADSICRVGRRIFIDGTRFDAALLGRSVPPNTEPTYLTIRQVAAKHPALTEPGVRQLIQKSEEYTGR